MQNAECRMQNVGRHKCLGLYSFADIKLLFFC